MTQAAEVIQLSGEVARLKNALTDATRTLTEILTQTSDLRVAHRLSKECLLRLVLAGVGRLLPQVEAGDEANPREDLSLSPTPNAYYKKEVTWFSEPSKLKGGWR